MRKELFIIALAFVFAAQSFGAHAQTFSSGSLGVTPRAVQPILIDSAGVGNVGLNSQPPPPSAADKDHRGEIDILSGSGVSGSGESTSGKTLDKATPKLMEANTGGDRGDPVPGIEHEDIGIVPTEDGRVIPGSRKIAPNTPEPVAADVFLKFEGIEGEAKDVSGDDRRAMRQKKSELIESIGSAIRIDAVGLNPQPEPPSTEEPGHPHSDAVSAHTHDSDVVGLNPQPEPPSQPKSSGDVVVIGKKIKENSAFAGAIAAGNLVPKRPTDVVTDEDLQLYSARVAFEDENIDRVRVADTAIELHYQQPARLFGFLSIKLRQEISVEIQADGQLGRVKVKYPWYHIFSRKSVTTADVQAAVTDELTAAPDISEEDVPRESVSLNFAKIKVEYQKVGQRKAQILQTISSVSKAMHDTAMSIIQNIR